MSESQEMVQAASRGDARAFQEAFDRAITARAFERVQERREDLAQTLFNAPPAEEVTEHVADGDGTGASPWHFHTKAAMTHDEAATHHKATCEFHKAKGNVTQAGKHAGISAAHAQAADAHYKLADMMADHTADVDRDDRR